jgi:hypothetical protein
MEIASEPVHFRLAPSRAGLSDERLRTGCSNARRGNADAHRARKNEARGCGLFDLRRGLRSFASHPEGLSDGAPGILHRIAKIVSGHAKALGRRCDLERFLIPLLVQLFGEGVYHRRTNPQDHGPFSMLLCMGTRHFSIASVTVLKFQLLVHLGNRGIMHVHEELVRGHARESAGNRHGLVSLEQIQPSRYWKKLPVPVELVGPLEQSDLHAAR